MSAASKLMLQEMHGYTETLNDGTITVSEQQHMNAANQLVELQIHPLRDQIGQHHKSHAEIYKLMKRKPVLKEQAQI